LLKIASLNSSYIVDVLVCFLAVHPEVVNLKDYSWKLCFESVMSYLMEDGNRKMTPEETIKVLEEENNRMNKILEERRESVKPYLSRISSSILDPKHSEKEVKERLDHCISVAGLGFDCVETSRT